MKLVVDTYSWIEYFEGSDQGKKARSYLEDPRNSLITPSIVVAELSDAHSRGKVKMPWDEIIRFINVHSEKADINDEIAANVGSIKKKLRERFPGAGIIDAIILATATCLQASLLTGDLHLTKEKGVVDIRS